MCNLVIIVLGVSALFSVQASSARKKTYRIVQGRKAFIEEFPYQVSLELMYLHVCGGSIIHPRIIISAAHCIAHLNESESILPAELRVRVGASIAEKRGKIYKVERVTLHEKYDDVAVTDTYDIGLVLLVKAIKINPKAYPVKLAVESPSAGEKAWVTGYGSQKAQKRMLTFPARQLMAVEIPIVKTTACKSNMRFRGFVVAEDMICAGGKSRMDACRGDSGGPLVINSTLYGLTAWGLGCGQNNTPGVYTDVSQYTDWLVEKFVALLKGPKNTTISDNNHHKNNNKTISQ